MRLIATLAATVLAGHLAAAVQAATPFVDSLPRAVDTGTPTPRGLVLSDRADVLPVADRVLVHKAERRLFLKRDGVVLRSYRVALGLNPVGHKEREGDFRTPEGQYRLVRRNPRSEFFLSMQVSYPDDEDLRQARRNGWPAGGAIMIHGLPNDPRKGLDYYATQDWTDGCIAVTNADMLEIWMLVPDGTPIEIRP